MQKKRYNGKHHVYVYCHVLITEINRMVYIENLSPSCSILSFHQGTSRQFLGSCKKKQNHYLQIYFLVFQNLKQMSVSLVITRMRYI
jgi:hypothetical protein